ncbi:uncharacterized protein LOC124291904 [Haliotis rubra]|uniref:uncharacterized protein LOC124291904 n=1 Tax=Haliotis rubra TaxID=36100 RepID=UPI001EE56661|nr:uncharacterized protein LOC124291904 [Haliotis rubra]
MVPSGKGNRMIVLHAGSRDKGLIDGCELVFEAKKSSGDYHQEMNGGVFMDWMEHQLLPNLDQPTVIVMDNASYHNVREPGSITPTMSSLKKTMQDFLTSCGVHYRPADTKIQLMEKIHINRKPIQYTADELAAQHGHVVLRSPVRHCELNPMELIWANCKGFVARNNSTFKLSHVKELIHASFGRITSEVWQTAEDHVLDIERKYRQRDGVDISVVAPVVIQVHEDTDSDSDSD